MVTVRQEFLLKSIRRSAKGMTVNELCEKLKISERTLKDDIKQLESFLENYNIEINYDLKNSTYFIKEEDKNRVQKIIVENEKLFDWIPKESAEREFYILFELIWKSDYLVMEELGDNIYVSKATISKDVKKVSRWVKEVIGEDVEIIKGKGIRLITTEKNKRKLISSCIYRYYETDCKYLLKMFYYYIGEDSKEYTKLNSKMIDFFKQRKIVLDQESFVTLILEIIAYIGRIKHGFYIEDSYEKLSEDQLEYLPFDKIESIFNISLVEAEKKAIINIYKYKNFLSMEKQYISELAEVIFEEFKNEIEEKYKIYISLENSDLIYKWKKHISSMIYRRQLSYKIDQRMVGEIIKEYQESFNVVKCMGYIIRERANIEMTKMDYACQALYLEAARKNAFKQINIAIVSNNSYIVIEEMKRRIKNNFGNKVRVLYTYSVSQLPQIEDVEEKPDLIFATHLVKYKCNIPIINVSDFLNDDIDEIKKYINEFQIKL